MFPASTTFLELAYILGAFLCPTAPLKVTAGLKAVRDRIASVKSTQKITEAMKLVAAAKVRRAQTAVINGRPFSENLVKVHTGKECESGMECAVHAHLPKAHDLKTCNSREMQFNVRFLRAAPGTSALEIGDHCSEDLQ